MFKGKEELYHCNINELTLYMNLKLFVKINKKVMVQTKKWKSSFACKL